MPAKAVILTRCFIQVNFIVVRGGFLKISRDTLCDYVFLQLGCLLFTVVMPLLIAPRIKGLKCDILTISHT